MPISLVVVALSALPLARVAAVSPLLARGYTVLPDPQQVRLDPGDFQFGSDWVLQREKKLSPEESAVQRLKEGLRERFHLNLRETDSASPTSHTLLLELHPGAVVPGTFTDVNKNAVARQGYEMQLTGQRVRIVANASAGLFYGVQTFLQLLTPRNGKLWLPRGKIVDWPDLSLRVIYWDDAHHLEHLDVLERAIREAAFFKVNGFALKLEGHFQYKHAAPIVEPYALTPAQLQELTDYALRYHVQLIPYLDGPAHVSFILKHPEYAKLREFPESNYEFCVTNPDTYRLLFGMYRDLLEANRGGKYFFLSTDEPYYVGMADKGQCREAERAKELGGRGKLLAEFITRTAGYLYKRGRTVLFWGEYPLAPQDVPALPNYVVNAEVNDAAFNAAFKAQGIRQMIYTSTQGMEPIFPNYFILPASERLHPGRPAVGRVQTMFEKISFTPARRQSKLIGAIVAGWADAGLHPATFWLGYATGLAAAWHPGTPTPREAMSDFFALFYGRHARNLSRIYQLLSRQAQFWDDSWERTWSHARTPIFGYSAGIYHPPHPAHDQTLPRLPVPAGNDLSLSNDWSSDNAKRIDLAKKFLNENDELQARLLENLPIAGWHRYNLEVLLSVARLCRQNLEMLLDLDQIAGRLRSAHSFAVQNKAEQAVGELDQAEDIARRIRDNRNRVLRDVVETWDKSWFPRVAEANGRRYLQQVSDVKDHLPIRTVDMSYLVYRELLYPLGQWAKRVRAVRNQYAEAHHLPARTGQLDWDDTQTLAAPQTNRFKGNHGTLGINGTREGLPEPNLLVGNCNR